jgi:hypothetical protein
MELRPSSEANFSAIQEIPRAEGMLSLPSPQDSATGLYPEPDESSLNCPLLFLYDPISRPPIHA